LTITRSDLQPQFKFEISGMPGGESITQCFDCGSCAGICPVSKSEPGFNPRKILHMIKLGLKDRLLGSEFLWYCSHCDICMFVCPQNVRFSDVVDVLRDMSINEGYAGSKGYEQWGTSPCKASCPAHISIQGFVGAIADGRYGDGLKLIKEEMPFPAACGRVCHHPCETQCNRSLVDKPVAIKFLKRFLADFDLFSETPYVPKAKEKKEKKVAVIGAGPAGLTVAYYLAIEGYPVTVYEKLPVAGGMLAVGIPEYRLPRNILEAEIDIIKKLNVDIKLHSEIGKDLSFDELQGEYDAIFIGVGCHQAMKLGIPGESNLAGITDCVMFLRDISLGNPPDYKGRLVVIGGGNAAIDCARAAKRLGPVDVTILYRRTRKEMPAIQEEIEEAIEEGVDIQPLIAPVKFIGNNGSVTAIECIRMSLGEPDESGRPRPTPVKDSEFIIKADVAIVAIGQAPEISFLTDSCKLALSSGNLIKTDTLTGTTNIPGIFAGGDIVSGPRTVVEAIASGKEAALSIDRYLKEEDMVMARKREWKGCKFTPDCIVFHEREHMKRLPLEERRRTFKEIAQGFNEEQVRSEAGRCYRICGIQQPH
jgi:NADPH-dependent glutamate synthase beta subunit-like oxidoreductase/NAD-dependent dihydropyrimidine dehydrogenase PreA subunit